MRARRNLHQDALATTADRCRKSGWTVADEDDHGARRGFLERFQQCIRRIGVHCVGRIDRDQLQAAELGRQRQALRQRTNLLDRDLGAQLAVVTRLERDVRAIRMRAGGKQTASAARGAGMARGRARFAQRGAHECIDQGTLAETGGATNQQGMRQLAKRKALREGSPRIVKPGRKAHRASPRPAMNPSTASTASLRT